MARKAAKAVLVRRHKDGFVAQITVNDVVYTATYASEPSYCDATWEPFEPIGARRTVRYEVAMFRIGQVVKVAPGVAYNLEILPENDRVREVTLHPMALPSFGMICSWKPLSSQYPILKGHIRADDNWQAVDWTGATPPPELAGAFEDALTARRRAMDITV